MRYKRSMKSVNVKSERSTNASTKRPTLWNHGGSGTFGPSHGDFVRCIEPRLQQSSEERLGGWCDGVRFMVTGCKRPKLAAMFPSHAVEEDRLWVAVTSRTRLPFVSGR